MPVGEIGTLQPIAYVVAESRPKAYRFVAQLPKNAYGKVLKTELRQMETRRAQ